MTQEELDEGWEALEEAIGILEWGEDEEIEKIVEDLRDAQNALEVYMENHA